MKEQGVMSFIKFLTGENPQMESMIGPALEKLRLVPAEQVCRLSGARYDPEDSTVILSSLGRELRLHVPEYEPECGIRFIEKTEQFPVPEEPPVEAWHYLTLLQYLNTADGTPLSGNWVSLRELPQGGTRGMGFDAEIGQIFETAFTGMSGKSFETLCTAAGGRVFPGKADACADFFFAPNFPVRIRFWEEDEEFPPSGKVLVDANAGHYLSMEGCGTACLLTVRSIARKQGPEQE